MRQRASSYLFRSARNSWRTAVRGTGYGVDRSAIVRVLSRLKAADTPAQRRSPLELLVRHRFVSIRSDNLQNMPRETSLRYFHLVCFSGRLHKHLKYAAEQSEDDSKDLRWYEEV
jgi:hypothetical protein